MTKTNTRIDNTNINIDRINRATQGSIEGLRSELGKINDPREGSIAKINDDISQIRRDYQPKVPEWKQEVAHEGIELGAPRNARELRYGRPPGPLTVARENGKQAPIGKN